MFDINICGEGGEFETFALDAPIFKYRLEISDSEVLSEGPCHELRIKGIRLLDKATGQVWEEVLEEKSQSKLLFNHIDYFYTSELTYKSFGHSSVSSLEHETFLVLKGLKQLL